MQSKRPGQSKTNGMEAVVVTLERLRLAEKLDQETTQLCASRKRRDSVAAFRWRNRASDARCRFSGDEIAATAGRHNFPKRKGWLRTDGSDAGDRVLQLARTIRRALTRTVLKQRQEQKARSGMGLGGILRRIMLMLAAGILCCMAMI